MFFNNCNIVGISVAAHIGQVTFEKQIFNLKVFTWLNKGQLNYYIYFFQLNM